MISEATNYKVGGGSWELFLSSRTYAMGFNFHIYRKGKTTAQHGFDYFVGR